MVNQKNQTGGRVSVTWQQEKLRDLMPGSPIDEVSADLSSWRRWPPRNSRKKEWGCSNPCGTSLVEQVDLSFCSVSEPHTLYRAFSTSTLRAVLSWLLRGHIPELCCLIPSVPGPDPAIWLQGSRTNQPRLAVFLPIMFDNAETV